MVKLNRAMRLAVKRDTFFLPNPDGSVYFRNNVGTFRMEGEMIDQWVSQLVPIFNGEHTLAEITDDLPAEYQAQIHKIASLLLENGFAQDVSQRLPHELSPAVVEQFSAQIAFLDHLIGSGGHAFQAYRQQKPLVAGSGSFVPALIHALWESGCPHVHYAVTDASLVNKARLTELHAHVRKKDDEAKLTELTVREQSRACWEKTLAPVSAVLYGSDSGDRSEMELVYALCQERGIVFIPVFLLLQKGIAGPVMQPSSPVCLDSVVRRFHRVFLSGNAEDHPFTATSAALLANAAVMEWFKHVTGVVKAESAGKLFLLDLDTLTGSWRTAMPHPLVKSKPRFLPVDEQSFFAETTSPKDGLLAAFQSWTSPDVGIFHTWEEGELIQLPLSQCQVQAVDPVAVGPAELLPVRICPGYTHEEARKEAGLAGTEMYVSRLMSACGIQAAGIHLHDDAPSMPDSAGEIGFAIGAGESAAEAACRALEHYLQAVLAKEVREQPPAAALVQWTGQDEPCLFYARALALQKQGHKIAKGADLCGFPVYWVGTENGWYGSVGLHDTLALRKALQTALQNSQGVPDEQIAYAVKALEVALDEREQQVELPPFPESEETLWQQARDVLAKERLVPVLRNAAVETFLQEDLSRVIALALRAEEGHEHGDYDCGRRTAG